MSRSSRLKTCASLLGIAAFASPVPAAFREPVQPTQGSPSGSMQRELFADPTFDFLIGTAGRLTKEDPAKSIDAMAAVLQELSERKQSLMSEIAKKRQRLQSATARTENATRCSQLALDIIGLRDRHGDWLTTVRQRLSRGTPIGPEEAGRLVGALGKGGKGGMALAFRVMSAVAELTADPARKDGDGRRHRD
jgi:hypothetical protein